MMEICIWEKTRIGYETDCGHITKNRVIRNYVYCPYCGSKIMRSRAEYHKKYYRERTKMQEA